MLATKTSTGSSVGKHERAILSFPGIKLGSGESCALVLRRPITGKHEVLEARLFILIPLS